MPENRLIAIGDIHGCDAALDTLLNALQPSSGDTLIVLGDCIDRGPNSRGVVERLLEVGAVCELVAILGNHEEMLLAVLDGARPDHWLPHGASATLDSYGFRGDLSCIPDDHVAFFRGMRSYFERDDYFFVHANYDAKLTLEEQPADLLRWTRIEKSTPDRHHSGKTAIVGHSANANGDIVDLGHLRCIDTGCYAGGWLTAMDVRADRVWQSNNAGELRSES